MATKNAPTEHQRVKLDSAGRFVIPHAVLAGLEQSHGLRIDVAAEVTKAEAWFAANLRRRTDADLFLKGWLRRAAEDARQRGPALAVIAGGGQSTSRDRPALSLVACTAVDGGHCVG